MKRLFLGLASMARQLVPRTARAKQPLLEAMVLAYLLVVSTLGAVYGIAAGIDAIRGAAVRDYVAGQAQIAERNRQKEHDDRAAFDKQTNKFMKPYRDAEAAQQRALQKSLAESQKRQLTPADPTDSLLKELDKIKQKHERERNTI